MNCVECFKKDAAVGAVYVHLGKSLCGYCLPESIKKAETLIDELDAMRIDLSSTNREWQEIVGNLQIAAARAEGVERK